MDSGLREAILASMKAKLTPVEGEDPKKPKVLPLTMEDKAHWNGFADYIAKKGYAGKAELDVRDTNLSRKLYDEYNKSKGYTTEYAYDRFVPTVQKEIADYRNHLIDETKAGRQKMLVNGQIYGGDLNAFDYDKEFMPGLSNVDGWAGSKTTGFKFPGVDRGGGEISQADYQRLYGGKKL